MHFKDKKCNKDKIEGTCGLFLEHDIMCYLCLSRGQQTVRLLRYNITSFTKLSFYYLGIHIQYITQSIHMMLF